MNTTVPSSWLDTDFYAILGVPHDASDAQIKAQFRSLARIHHPDATSEGDERFKAVSQAYEVLGSPSSRADYDAFRASQTEPSLNYGSAPFSGFDTFDTFFSDMFTPRDAEYATDVTLSFSEAFAGTNISLRYPSPDGSTADCTVRIPPGALDGSTYAATPTAGVKVFATIHVAPHSVFSLSGHDVHLDVLVGFDEAVLGATLTLPTPDGTTVKVKLPPATGTALPTLRVRSRGWPHPDGTRGDLFAHPIIGLPAASSDAVRKVASELADCTSSASLRAPMLARCS